MTRAERPSTLNANSLNRWETVMVRELSEAESEARNTLYSAGEDGSAIGLSLEEAIQAVIDGYSSLEADRAFSVAWNPSR